VAITDWVRVRWVSDRGLEMPFQVIVNWGCRLTVLCMGKVRVANGTDLIF
jgi:hypothetical protein